MEHIPSRAPQWVSELLRGSHTPASITPWRFRDQGVCVEGGIGAGQLTERSRCGGGAGGLTWVQYFFSFFHPVPVSCC